MEPCKSYNTPIVIQVKSKKHISTNAILSPAVRPTPTTLTLSCTGRAAGGTTLTRRAVEVMSPQWSPLPAEVCPLTGWWASLWTWAAATSSPVEALTWSTEATWKGAVTTYHTRRAPPQLWWVRLKSVKLDSCMFVPDKRPDVAKLSI